MQKQLPSTALLQLITTQLRAKNITTKALSQQTKLDKKVLKHVLSGEEPLTVDQFALISQAIELDVSSVVQLDTEMMEQNTSPTPTIAPTPEKNWEPDPVGNHPMQLMQLGFALGCDFLFTANTRFLQNSGIPSAVLKKYQQNIPIRLDSAYFQYYRPQYHPESLEIRLSFDAVYTCYFPWHAIEQVTFFVDEEEPVAPPPEEEISSADTHSSPDDSNAETTPKTNSAPFLRIIK